ncbi:MAG: Spo0E family sporulation regulatory protein-aspartic acid phosphatase [Clostridium perfringens]|uniref:Uncharacterized protein n=1 Tax=Clostridium butyricum E4 str. BoNT E BL5262 TaxID=632245 RepID=C4IFB1_CLOBU|nr:Spo0E family sporulation regulatory protein-aspartic acid phosphatase [Clostridium butyricum]MDU5776267.1 Spo0E family sporulation regulatory protein-aspartic acid phosphatase [Clostridium perfringens]EDT77019.1 conserved hypothetical protein [Clostridium butyricum 5521]EEP53118.1 conserved hypothetical protein [Clostridium butyricum E4 str. BoNT E BL5262]MDU5720814.1 Spo0E family sporulation regulatory protein-aspartic acid phosphatase [Clostridium butyricum]NFL32986.1 hypothetical protein
MKIDMEVTTEQARENMHNQIKNSEKLTDLNVVKASEDLDKKILEEMLRDPVIENQYLKRLLKSKDEQIRNLQNKIYEKNRIEDLAEITVMKCEAGLNALNAIQLAVFEARREGIL